MPLLCLFVLDIAHFTCLFFSSPLFFLFALSVTLFPELEKTDRHFKDEAQGLATASLECKMQAVVSGGFQLRQLEDRLGTPFNPDFTSKCSSSSMNSGFTQYRYRHRQENNKGALMFYNCRYTTGRQSDPHCSHTVNGNSRML